MKAKPMKFDGVRTYTPCSPGEATHVGLRTPGPTYYRLMPLSGDPHWEWNRDTEKPTLNPSILLKGKRMPTDEEAARIMAGEKVELPDEVCHCFIRNGKIQFLGDCTHELAGKTVDLLEVD